MTTERWARLRSLFFSAMDRSPAERATFLDQECADDAQLRQDVESLLASHEQAGAFLETPAVAVPSGELSPPTPTLAAGTCLGPYEIAAVIGSGGMGVVYRARDVRLGRDVAVKVLPRDLAADADRRGRFELEARAASALNHPNIVAVYDTGSHDGMPFMVTELLDGRPLSEPMAQGPLPVRKALECALQAARGLVAAHERGIVHRDLKPANLFLTAQGQIKILDFGVAKLHAGERLARAAGSPDGPATTPGLVLGTVGYMSPEQVRGGPVDVRSDQFSLGCVLYELLAGRAPFSRPTAAQTMAAVLEDDPPPLADANPRAPMPVVWLVERCLAKDPDDRYSSTRDLARDLELALTRLSDASGRAVARRRRAAAAPTVWALALAAVAAGGAWWAVSHRERTTVATVRYLTYSGRDSSPAAAPDGRTVAFSSSRDGRQRIWLKQLGTGSEAPLTAGEDDHPRFSADGSVVLFAHREGGRTSLYRVPSLGGEARRVVDDALYGDYSPDGRLIAFVRQVEDKAGITTVVGVAGPDGSSAREVARLEGSTFVESAFAQPRWSPDGRTLAATQSTHQLGEPNVIVLLDVESGRVRKVSPPGGAGLFRGGLSWAGADAVLYSEPETVAGQQTSTSSRVVLLDLASGKVRPLLSSPANLPRADVLGPGRLLLEARSLRQNLREIPLGPAPFARRRWLTRGNSSDRQPIYARDGEWIAFSSNRAGNLDIWALSRRTGAVRRLTDDAADDSDPGFMPDGRLLWSSNRSGRFEIWLAAPDGSGARQVTHDGADAENPVATPDGQWIVYASANPRTRGIMKIHPDGSEATLLVPGAAMLEPEVSPDGRYVSYVAEAGSERAALRVARLADGAPTPFEVPVARFGPGTSIDRGRSRWLPDSRGIAYIDEDDDGRYAVYTRTFTPAAGPRRRVAGVEPDLDAESLAVSPDGASLLVSFREELVDLMLAENVPGLDHARRPPD